MRLVDASNVATSRDFRPARLLYLPGDSGHFGYYVCYSAQLPKLPNDHYTLPRRIAELPAK